MKLGTKVALKKKFPLRDHRCKGFVTKDFAEVKEIIFWCFKCMEFHWADKRGVVRVVPKPVGWVNFTPRGEIDLLINEDLKGAKVFARAEGWAKAVAPVYLGRKRKVKSNE